MRKYLLHIVLILALGYTTSALADTGGDFLVLSFHDVQDVPSRNRVADAMTISTAELVAQFSWLREHGYHPIGIDDLLAAREGRRPLPDKALLLTFDDGYLSTYTRVFPLLKLFNYPAVVAPLAKWIDSREETIQYGDKPAPRSQFMTWAQLREMAQSGLVEIASHSYDLHHGIQGNPQGNLQPAVATRRYDPDSASYEDAATWRKRIHDDLLASTQAIARHTGHQPRVMVWPYGSYNQDAVDIARELGMPVTLTLDSGPNNVHRLQAVRRILVTDGDTLADVVTSLYYPDTPGPIRVAHVDLDYIYDEDPAQQERNLGRLLDRIKDLQINTVYLQAYADPDGDGNADALYFPNRHLPMRADLFNRVAWQLFTRAGVMVYAWLPVMSFDLGENHPAGNLLVRRLAHDGSPAATPDYRRLTPFSAMTLKTVTEIYEDLAIHASFHGLLFHDDAYLSDHEDASEAALQVYNKQWKLPPSIADIRQDPELFQRWSRRKTETLIYWTQRLADQARRYRPGIRTARNLYARVILDPQAETWFAQSLDLFLENYDYTAVMAMPYMEQARHPRRWLKKLVERVAEKPGALQKTVFELQARDWRSGAAVGSDELQAQMGLLLNLGALNFGYYPDDFAQAHPDIQRIRPIMSLNSYPYPVP
ncbi:MAG TPA: poly-beta-1,6-N-acetyl-D-glucosamine N-deacetylase PgaB [Gammaproteobacteria bacterium]|nr:poly-beta-1,6-N-acetyl-D-glucosamine N-deacetylase PgaB [Gammaproteobacteria bacterium]